jgi:hypothetical protein
LTPSIPAGDFPGAESQPLDYPGPRPARSYLYVRGRVQVFGPGAGGASEVEPALAGRNVPPLGARVAVLAVGSNACPGRLLEKFGEAAVIPVLAGSIAGTAAVYVPRLSSYAALPATAWAAPGFESRLWVTLLDREQLAVMDATEAVGEMYKLVALPEPFRPEGGGELGPVYAYASGHALALDGGPVRLSAFASTAPFPALDERAVLARALDLAGVFPGRPLEDRHRALRDDPALRYETSGRLTGDYALAAPGFDRLPDRPPEVERAVREG